MTPDLQYTKNKWEKPETNIEGILVEVFGTSKISVKTLCS